MKCGTCNGSGVIPNPDGIGFIKCPECRVRKSLRAALLFVILFLPIFGNAMVDTSKLIMPIYAESYDEPIGINSGDVVSFLTDGYFINEKRYLFYRKLHEFALEDDFMGHERAILGEFQGFLDESDGILREMTDNTENLSNLSESLRTANESVNRLNAQLLEMQLMNSKLKEQLNTIGRTKQKWLKPTLIGAGIGIIGGLLLK